MKRATTLEGNRAAGRRAGGLNPRGARARGRGLGRAGRSRGRCAQARPEARVLVHRCGSASKGAVPAGAIQPGMDVSRSRGRRVMCSWVDRGPGLTAGRLSLVEHDDTLGRMQGQSGGQIPHRDLNSGRRACQDEREVIISEADRGWTSCGQSRPTRR